MSKRNENRPGYIETKLGYLFQNSKKVGISGLPIFSVTINSGLIYRKTLDRKMAPNLPPEKSLLIESGDIVYNMMRMWQGAVAVCNQRGVVSPAYVVCNPNSKINSNFTCYLFKIPYMLHKLKSFSYGIADDRLRLYYKDFAMIPIKVPPLPEQKKIAEILSTWDAAIEQTRKLIDAKKRRKKALMQQLLTGKKRLPGFNGDWKEYPMGELFKERREANYGHLPLLAITGSQGIIPASQIKRKDSSNEDKSKYKRIVPGDLGYNTMRMWQGVSAVSTLEGIVSPAYTICIPKDLVDVGFMGYFFKFPTVINLFWRYSQGLVNDTLNLKYNNFSQIKVVMPDIEEQRRIAQVLSVADNEINQLEKKLNALEKQKRGLMQKLLTGEVRVK
jgi:type I restriction enzyme S subunit